MSEAKAIYKTQQYESATGCMGCIDRDGQIDVLKGQLAQAATDPTGYWQAVTREERKKTAAALRLAAERNASIADLHQQLRDAHITICGLQAQLDECGQALAEATAQNREKPA